MTGYREAMRESERADFLTKVEVTRAVRDSGRAVAMRLRKLEHGVEDFIQELEKYYQALGPEDWVEKSWSGAQLAAGIMGLTAGAITALAADLLVAIFTTGFTTGAYLAARIVAYPTLGYFGLRLLHYTYHLYHEYIPASHQPSLALSILARTVDPAEKAMYAVLGGGRPARTLERVKQLRAILIGGSLFVFALGVVFGFLQRLMP